MNHVVLSKRAVRGLERAPDHIRKKSVEVLDALQESFAPVKMFDIKKLKGSEDTFRIRLGDWRIIYEFRRKELVVVVLDIAPRGRAY